MWHSARGKDRHVLSSHHWNVYLATLGTINLQILLGKQKVQETTKKKRKSMQPILCFLQRKNHLLLKGMVLRKMKTVIIYSASILLKPVWFHSFFFYCWFQMNIFCTGRGGKSFEASKRKQKFHKSSPYDFIGA